MKKPRFIISGGGTGGHIYPAVAIANELKTRFPEAEFLFVGAKDKMEMQKVPQAGYAIKGLWISGIQRKLTLDNAMFPFKLLSSMWNSFRIIKSFKPDVVMRVGDIFSLMNMVSGDLGHSLLPGRVRALMGDAIEFTPLLPKYQVIQRIGLMYLQANESNPNILALAAEARMLHRKNS